MSAIDPSRPSHRRAASSPHYPTRYPSHQMAPPSDSPRPRAASRLIHSVKRTLSPSTMAAKRPHPHPKSGMQSTVAESASAVPPQQQQFREVDPSPSRPTIEQIAMGLHISRTPHLRPLASSPYAFSQRNSAPHSANPYEHHHHRPTPITLPPPPTRSSMKKPSTTVTSSTSSPAVSPPPFSSASGSTTTITSVAPSAAHVPRSFAAIKYRMARFLPQSRSASAPPLVPPPASPRDSTSDSIQPKKAVRFEDSDDGHSPRG
ncbi:hypothetical protein HYPSUDRAFT_62413 [Hypholoma sublateritium FD-334 SS-4]|uniref:Uncharacterized protein n=1 Tax=Hypholoma sublateritium (strain FD-334 SS-4) TaxID=945553 RepID=A0A0D2MVL4_HYPSF|nr:hypothetical protein HYPSUDRAFT_62413 [Hypholoma sublateritium FD-334 SS-4]